MHRISRRTSEAIFAFCCCVGLITTPTPVRGATSKGQIDFNRDIRPILSENCFHCHGSDPKARKAKLRLDTAEGAHQSAVVPGKPQESELITRILSTDPEEVMPPPDSNRRISKEQKALLSKWVSEGAAYDQHWAFKPPIQAPLPKVKKAGWPKNEIDHFILAKIEAAKLKPSKPADTERLLRRVSLDLTGLPPTLQQMKHWREQKDPFLTAVDELLASPQFGERMASDWMDVARYADTHGFNNDSLRSMWRWRDWVIDSFNSNKPYNEFIREQLAGDLLPNPTMDQLIATGFNRNHVINSEGGIIDEEYRIEYVADRVRTFSTAWLGLSMECARCHDHKFDPITQKDFFKMFAFFNNVDEHGEAGRMANAAPFILSPTKDQVQQAAVHRTAMETAETKMQALLAAHQPTASTITNTLQSVPKTEPSTNLLIQLDFAGWKGSDASISNLAGGSFKPEGNLTLDHSPSGEDALVFNGSSSLKTSLPKGDDKWMFAAWVRRDQAQKGPLLTTMDFSSPASAAGHGNGVDILLTESGAIEVRAARRWPAYAIYLITRETLPLGEWQHVTVVCDGSNKAAGMRVLLNGEECFRTVLQDDFAVTQINGKALIGASMEKDFPLFAGALSGLTLTAKPSEFEKVMGSIREEIQHVALGKLSTSKTFAPHVLRQTNPEFAKVEGEWRQARSGLLRIERDAPTTMIMRELKTPRQTAVLFRGQYDQPRDIVEAGSPGFILPFPKGTPQNRLGLATWLTDPRHPLTSRVIVNRFWQSIFGTGIVKSAEDFGVQSDWPSHPELLDWMAIEFQNNGWDVKKLLRLMVTSATYRQDSNSSAELNELDPENRLLARAPRMRLSAEVLRDQAIQHSGLLHQQIGGAPVFPYQPTNLYQGIVVAAPYPGTTYKDGSGNDLYRRSLYTFWKRTVPHPSLGTFDAPDREVCVARRLKTNTPLQALASMNDTIQLEAARKLAERMLTECSQAPEKRIQFAFQLVTARKPDSFEQKQLALLLKNRLAFYRKTPDEAKALLAVGSSKTNETLDAAELAAYANVASLLLNLDETLTRN